MLIGIVDYGMGNLQSVWNAIDYVGGDPLLVTQPDQLDECSHVILPGVGAFGAVMDNLRRTGFDEALRRAVLEQAKPFLGICLGLQVLAKTSDEHGRHDGLGWFDAHVRRFDPKPGLEVPHMGWNDIRVSQDHPVLRGYNRGKPCFYFTHSHYIVCDDSAEVAAWCDHGGEFACAIAHDTMIATQFHPEKSQDNGLRLFENFVAWRP